MVREIDESTLITDNQKEVVFDFLKEGKLYSGYFVFHFFTQEEKERRAQQKECLKRLQEIEETEEISKLYAMASRYFYNDLTFCKTQKVADRSLGRV